MHYRFQIGEKTYRISIERQGESFRASVDGNTFELEILDSGPGQISLIVEGRPVILHWANDGSRKWVSMNGCTYRVEKPSRHSGRRGRETASTGTLRSPMPAQVRSIETAEGDKVDQGETLLLLEAMKMEIRIKAPQPSQVAHILVQAGQTVEKDQPLVELLDISDI